MNDESDPQTNPETASGAESASTQANPSSDASWQEVGRQFETLGATLSQALRTTWNRVEGSPDAQQVKVGLEALLRDVGKAVEDAAATPEAQKLKEEAKRTAASLRVAGEQTVQEARPQIISALKQVNEELNKLINILTNLPAGALREIKRLWRVSRTAMSDVNSEIYVNSISALKQSNEAQELLTKFLNKTK